MAEKNRSNNPWKRRFILNEHKKRILVMIIFHPLECQNHSIILTKHLASSSVGWGRDAEWVFLAHSTCNHITLTAKQRGRLAPAFFSQSQNFMINFWIFLKTEESVLNQVFKDFLKHHSDNCFLQLLEVSVYQALRIKIIKPRCIFESTLENMELSCETYILEMQPVVLKKNEIDSEEKLLQIAFFADFGP